MEVFEWASTIMAVLASLIILSITLLVSYNALSRWWMGQTVPGSNQVVEAGLVWLTFLGAAWILRRDGHVKVDVLYMVLPDRIVRYLWYLGMILAALATAGMVYFSAVEVLKQFESGRRVYGQIAFERWIIMWMIPFGFAMLALEFLLVLLKGPENRDVLGQQKLFGLGKESTSSGDGDGS